MSPIMSPIMTPYNLLADQILTAMQEERDSKMLREMNGKVCAKKQELYLGIYKPQPEEQ
jgi:hypothetical protein